MKAKDAMRIVRLAMPEGGCLPEEIEALRILEAGAASLDARAACEEAMKATTHSPLRPIREGDDRRLHEAYLTARTADRKALRAYLTALRQTGAREGGNADR